VGDDDVNVSRNLERAGAALGVAPERVYFLSQVHGRQVVWVDGTKPREKVLFEEGDAVLSRTTDLACGVRTADCVPILLADPITGAVAAVHAGWRGAVEHVMEAAVTALRDAGAEASSLIAAIGPHISLAAFEVSEEVAAQLVDSSPDRNVVSRDFGSKPHVDLRRIVRAQLGALGLAESAIDDVNGCTVYDDDLFSYRRDGKRSGRHLAAIVPMNRH
jgi:YfiH family protein